MAHCSITLAWKIPRTEEPGGLQSVGLKSPTLRTERACAHTHRHTHTQTQTHRHTDTHTQTQTHRHTDTDTHRHRHRHTHTDTDTHTQTHTQTQTHTRTFIDLKVGHHQSQHLKRRSDLPHWYCYWTLGGKGCPLGRTCLAARCLTTHRTFPAPCAL